MRHLAALDFVVLCPSHGDDGVAVVAERVRAMLRGS